MIGKDKRERGRGRGNARICIASFLEKTNGNEKVPISLNRG